MRLLYCLLRPFPVLYNQSFFTEIEILANLIAYFVNIYIIY